MCEDTYYLDRAQRTVSTFPTQAAVDYERNEPRALLLQCLDGGEMRRIQIPTLSYKIIMQKRYQTTKATIKAFTKTVAISKNQSSIYSDLGSSNDGPLSDDENVPKKTDTTELKIDDSLLHFIEALPHLEPIHYGFHLQRTNQTASCMCSSAHGLNPWRTANEIMQITNCAGIPSLNLKATFNIILPKETIIINQPPITLKNCMMHEAKKV
jgi:hypothetical protein